MKNIQPADAAQNQKLMGEVRLARLQLAKAESQLAKATITTGTQATIAPPDQKLNNADINP